MAGSLDVGSTAPVKTTSAVNDASSKLSAEGPGAGDLKAKIEEDVVIPPGVSATVGSGALIIAGDDVAVRAIETIDVDVIAGGAAFGIVGIGAGVVVLNVQSTTIASISGEVWAGGDVLIRAQLIDSIDVQSFAGAFGYVGLGAAVTIITDNSSQFASSEMTG